MVGTPAASDEKTAPDWWNKSGPGYPLVAKGDSIASDYKVAGYPSYYVIRPNGKVAAFFQDYPGSDKLAAPSTRLQVSLHGHPAHVPWLKAHRNPSDGAKPIAPSLVFCAPLPGPYCPTTPAHSTGNCATSLSNACCSVRLRQSSTGVRGCPALASCVSLAVASLRPRCTHCACPSRGRARGGETLAFWFGRCPG